MHGIEDVVQGRFLFYAGAPEAQEMPRRAVDVVDAPAGAEKRGRGFAGAAAYSSVM